MHKINLTSLSDCYTLSNQVHIPCIALGTWQSSPELTADAVQKAVESGYRHLDCAAVYGNEKDVGRGIAQAGLPRKELFLTSKVWNMDRGYEKTLKAFEASCLDLGTDYLDLYMIHWPANRKMYPNDWQKEIWTHGVLWKSYIMMVESEQSVFPTLCPTIWRVYCTRLK